VHVSGPGDGNGRGEQPPEDTGVLANLPRTRPQRASPRRAAARRATSAREQDLGAGNGDGRAARTPARKAATTAGGRAGGEQERPAPASRQAKPARPKATRAPRKRQPEPIPKQGYESVEERATGPVQPPGGTELLGTAAEIVSELAKAGLSGGERVVRDLLSRLGR
jgi:hypothetical protein